MRRVAVVFAAVVAALVAAAPAGAAAPPWRAGAQVGDALFAAQQAQLLGGPGRAAVLQRARRAYRGPLRSGIRAADPAAHRAVLAGLRDAGRARGLTALAAARGSVQAALMRGAAAATLAAVEAGDAAEARRWLLLREFRTATRYTRPGADATVALRDLERGRLGPAKARLAVLKDLLDATQGKARERIEEIGRLGARGFAAHRAEIAARVAGAWPQLAPRYAAERGDEAAAEADAAMTALRSAALRDDDTAVEDARERAGAVLGSFTAAPFTPGELARRASQLAKFVSLIPVEYGAGVEGTRVTVAFEIQEGVAFSAAARAAFADLRGTLERIDRDAAADVGARLDALDGLLRGAQERPGSVPETGAVEAQAEAIGSRLAALYPDAWEEQSDAGDFDLIQISLDRLEQQVAAGRYRQAEQTRVELYAIFEFGPERRLQAFDPALAAEVEGLIWFGAGLAGTGRPRRRPALLGALAGLGVSIVTFVLATTLLDSLQRYGERLEAGVGLVAIAVLLLVMNWFFHRVYWTEWISSFHKRRRALLARDEDARVAFFSAQVLGLFLLGLSSVYREGFETTLFLQSLGLSAGLAPTVAGAALGLAATGLVAVITFRLQRKLPYKRMLIVTGVLLAFVLVVMVGATVRTMQGAGWLPIHSLDLDLPYWLGTWLGVFPTWETLGGQVVALAFVIGSYYAAEYVRITRPRKLAAARREAAPQAGGAEAAPRSASSEAPPPHSAEPAPRSASSEAAPPPSAVPARRSAGAEPAPSAARAPERAAR